MYIPHAYLDRVFTFMSKFIRELIVYTSSTQIIKATQKFVNYFYLFLANYLIKESFLKTQHVTILMTVCLTYKSA